MNSQSKKSIMAELVEHAENMLGNVITEENIDDAHFHAFNEDYYIVGYYAAEQWLKKHGLSVFDAIAYVIEQYQEQFGETLSPEDINAERIVNLLVYFMGERIDFDALLEEYEAEQTAQ